MYASAGVHVDAEYTSEDKAEEDFIAEQPFAYPMGIGGVMMNDMLWHELLDRRRLL